MSYDECMNQLEPLGVKDKFKILFENTMSEDYMSLVKTNDKIKGVGWFIRDYMGHLEDFSKEWNYWRTVFFYLITPVFARANCEFKPEVNPNEQLNLF
jgi:hypothetical protein